MDVSSATTAPGLHATQGKQPLGERGQLPAPSSQQVDAAKETRDAFSQFVGATVFGQMLSSMRKTVGEPAYFHGGQAEEMFQGQMDHAIADEITNRGDSPFAQAMFEQQFPDHADVLRRDKAANAPSPLEQLNNLRRR